MWTLFASDVGNKTVLLTLNSERQPETLSVANLIAKVEAVTGAHDGETRILFGSREMVETDCLGDYPGLGDNSTISIVSRLFGGSRHVGRSVRRSNGPCVVTTCDFDVPQCIVMSCSHAIDPDMLYDMCNTEVYSNKKWEIHCPSCNKVWPLDEILKCGVTQAEIQSLVKGMSENWCMNNKSEDIRQCPGCRGFCMRDDVSNRRVRCINCTQQKVRVFEFCWYCLCEWFDGHRCKQETSLILQAARIKDIYGVQCPSIRACPKCGFVIEHAEKCKHMACKSCKQDFCFVCLSLKQPDGRWPCGSYSTKCPPAPKQTVA